MIVLWIAGLSVKIEIKHMQLNLYSLKRTQQMIKLGTILCRCLCVIGILYWSHSPYVKEWVGEEEGNI